jgi:hypothetical protein
VTAAFRFTAINSRNSRHLFLFVQFLELVGDFAVRGLQLHVRLASLVSRYCFARKVLAAASCFNSASRKWRMYRHNA